MRWRLTWRPIWPKPKPKELGQKKFSAMGVFDARSFAASWAAARGVVPTGHRAHRAGAEVSRTLIAGAVATLAAVIGGTVLLYQQFVPGRALPIPGAPHVRSALGNALGELGLILLIGGLVAAGSLSAAWLWQWAARRTQSRESESVALSNYV